MVVNINYRVPFQASGKSYTYNEKSYGGLDKFGSTVCPATVKYDEPNRSNYTHYESGRDVPLFRLAETFCFVLRLMDVKEIIMRL